jgi:hypothetical protein
MVRGSGDFVNQLDGYVVLRPISRRRLTEQTEDIQSRPTHPKARNGRLANPLLITMHVTGDDTDLVGFRFEAASIAAGDDTDEAVTAAALARNNSRASAARACSTPWPRKTSAASPLTPPSRPSSAKPSSVAPSIRPRSAPRERGDWYVFVRPLLVDSEAPGADPDDEEDPA